MRYLTVIEQTQSGVGACVPDLPGRVAAGENRYEVVRLVREAIELHIEGLKEAGESVPLPSSASAVLDVHAA